MKRSEMIQKLIEASQSMFLSGLIAEPFDFTVASALIGRLEHEGMQPPKKTILPNSYNRTEGTYGFEVNEWDDEEIVRPEPVLVHTFNLDDSLNLNGEDIKKSAEQAAIENQPFYYYTFSYVKIAGVERIILNESSSKGTVHVLKEFDRYKVEVYGWYN